MVCIGSSWVWNLWRLSPRHYQSSLETLTERPGGWGMGGYEITTRFVSSLSKFTGVILYMGMWYKDNWQIMANPILYHPCMVYCIYLHLVNFKVNQYTIHGSYGHGSLMGFDLFCATPSLPKLLCRSIWSSLIICPPTRAQERSHLQVYQMWSKCERIVDRNKILLLTDVETVNLGHCFHPKRDWSLQSK